MPKIINTAGYDPIYNSNLFVLELEDDSKRVKE